MKWNWYHYSASAEILIALILVIVLLFIPAPYGRYLPKNNSKLNYSVTSKIAWTIMEIPALCTILVFYIIFYRPFASPTFLWQPLVFLGMWEIHYVYRALIYPWLLPNHKRKNMPVYIAISGSFFNILNGAINGWGLLKVKQYTVDNTFSTPFIVGICLFFIGFLFHAYSDRIIRIIRRTTNNYVIVNKFPYTLLAAPNYLGEIIQWIGWAIATWTYGGLAFAIFTIGNLFPRALYHHRWYRQTFADYPKNRKAIIPYIL